MSKNKLIEIKKKLMDLSINSIMFGTTSCAKNDKANDKEISYSNEVAFYSEIPEKLNIPQNVLLSDSYVASWDEVENAQSYGIVIQYEENGNIKTYEILSINGEINNGKVFYDMRGYILRGYNNAKLYGKKVNVSISIVAIPDYLNIENLVNSEYSLHSNEVALNSEINNCINDCDTGEKENILRFRQ